MIMKNLSALFLITSLLIPGCQPANETVQMENWKEEIRQAEQDFAAMADQDGIKEAFLYFAADDAVLLRNDELYEGMEAIRSYLTQSEDTTWTQQLSWEPDFIKVSSSGDLAYTYGSYQYWRTRNGEDTTRASGIFHTVWERQDNGQWKYVWD